MSMCVSAYVCACVCHCVCVRACVSPCMCVCVYMCSCVCVYVLCACVWSDLSMAPRRDSESLLLLTFSLLVQETGGTT